MKKKLLLLSLSSVMLLAACGGDNEEKETSKNDKEKTEQVDKKEEKEKGLLGIGDSIEINDITFTVTNSYYTDERNEFAEETPEKVIAIEYTIENNNDTDYPYGADTQVYVDGKQASTYPLDNSLGSVSSGRSVDGVIHYGVTGEKIELEWRPMFDTSDKGIWDVTPE